jgi:hypothetical protein
MEQQFEKAVPTQGNKLTGGGRRRVSRNIEENATNQGEYQGVILPPPPPQELGNQGTVLPDTAASDVRWDYISTEMPAPKPEKRHGLEPPPMPPGFSYN